MKQATIIYESGKPLHSSVEITIEFQEANAEVPWGRVASSWARQDNSKESEWEESRWTMYRP